MKRWTWSLALAVALFAACGDDEKDAAKAPPDPDGAWMDDAEVEVSTDAGSGRETVTLTDPETGWSEVLSDEPLDEDAVQFHDVAPGGAASRPDAG